MNLEVLIINGDRYIINTESPAVDQTCDELISQYPMEPTLDWDILRDIDFKNTKPWE